MIVTNTTNALGSYGKTNLVCLVVMFLAALIRVARSQCHYRYRWLRIQSHPIWSDVLRDQHKTSWMLWPPHYSIPARPVQFRPMFTCLMGNWASRHRQRHSTQWPHWHPLWSRPSAFWIITPQQRVQPHRITFPVSGKHSLLLSLILCTTPLPPVLSPYFLIFSRSLRFRPWITVKCYQTKNGPKGICDQSLGLYEYRTYSPLIVACVYKNPRNVRIRLNTMYKIGLRTNASLWVGCENHMYWNKPKLYLFRFFYALS